MKTIQKLEEIIYNLNKDNFAQTITSIKYLIHDDFSPYSMLTLCRLIYFAFLTQMQDYQLYLRFIKEFEETTNHKIFERFVHYILGLKSQESNFLLEKMIKLNIISSSSVRNKLTFYFAHYIPNKPKRGHEIPFENYFFNNYKELSKNDWELHKKYVAEGVNPNEIAKIIRNDEIEKFQEISSQTNFDFNQIIEPSLYERCSFINQKNVTLIDYAAFFGSIKCFKYLLMNGANVKNTGKYAIAGGNEEIIHLCEQNHSSFQKAYETAIQFHRNDIFKYLYENKIVEFFSERINNFIFFSYRTHKL